MTNPLIAKYEEIYGKKEEPKPEYVKPSQEQTDILFLFVSLMPKTKRTIVNV